MKERFPNTNCVTAACSVIDIVSLPASSELRSFDDSEIDSPTFTVSFQNSNLMSMKTFPVRGMKPRQHVKE
jgi:hypothetical protein